MTLVIIAAGCTGHEPSPSGKVSPQESQPAEQPTSPTTEQSTPASSIEQIAPTTTQNTVSSSGQNLTVHFLDVGQGDSILIGYENKSMLIDAGESDKGEVVTNYLHNQGISTLDYVVATHPHSDHIGGMNDVLNNFKVEHFIDS